MSGFLRFRSFGIFFLITSKQKRNKSYGKKKKQKPTHTQTFTCIHANKLGEPATISFGTANSKLIDKLLMNRIELESLTRSCRTLLKKKKKKMNGRNRSRTGLPYNVNLADFAQVSKTWSENIFSTFVS